MPPETTSRRIKEKFFLPYTSTTRHSLHGPNCLSFKTLFCWFPKYFLSLPFLLPSFTFALPPFLSSFLFLISQLFVIVTALSMSLYISPTLGLFSCFGVFSFVVTCRISVPRPRVEPQPWMAMKDQILTTRPPENSQGSVCLPQSIFTSCHQQYNCLHFNLPWNEKTIGPIF